MRLRHTRTSDRASSGHGPRTNDRYANDHCAHHGGGKHHGNVHHGGGKHSEAGGVLIPILSPSRTGS
jgi:hypothetical protein